MLMPLVCVRGAATRPRPRHQPQVGPRDALSRRLVLPRSAAVFEPDSGREGLNFDPTQPWMPEPGGAQPFAAAQGGQVGTVQVGIGGLARRQPDRAVDLAFEAGLAARVESAARRGDPAEALSAKELAAFEAAVRYLEAGADKTAFDPFGADTEFISALALELKAHAPDRAPAAEQMGPASDALQWLGQGLRELVSPLRATVSDGLLRIVRRPL